MIAQHAMVLATLAIIGCAPVYVAGNAVAQSAEHDIDLESRRAQQGAGLVTERPGQAYGFEAVVTAPILYTNFAVQTATDELISRKGDAHISPDLLLKYAHQFEWLKLTVGADLLMDRYLTQTAASEDALIGTVKAAFTDGRSDLFVPYVSYTASMDFLPTFTRRDDTLQDWAAGFSSAIGRTSGGGWIPYRTAYASGDSYVRFDARVGRRLSDPSDFQNVFAVASLQVGYFINQELEVSVTPALRARWYDDYFGEARRDFNAGALLLIAWTPDWLRRKVHGAEIDFTANFERNISNLPEKTYSRWEAGPALVFRAKF
jgi:hypothetical protein